MRTPQPGIKRVVAAHEPPVGFSECLNPCPDDVAIRRSARYPSMPKPRPSWPVGGAG